MMAWKEILCTLVLFWSIQFNAAAPRKGYVSIVGGDPVGIEQFPYQVSLRLGGDHICGGFIIDKSFIATAAHCSIGDADEYSVQVGASNLDEDGQFYDVEKIIEHPKYDYSGDYDICIMKLQKPLVLSDKVSIAKLSKTNKGFKKGTVFNITGWGDTEHFGSLSKVLLLSSVPWVDQKTCQKDYEGISEVNFRMLCAGTDGHDACQGDSGGPLSLNGEVVGVVSRGRSCAQARYPTIYTRVSRFIGWIKKTMDKNK